MSSPTANLALTAQEYKALSAALQTMLKLWGDSEDATQERIYNKLPEHCEKAGSLHIATYHRRGPPSKAPAQLRGRIDLSVSRVPLWVIRRGS